MNRRLPILALVIAVAAVALTAAPTAGAVEPEGPSTRVVGGTVVPNDPGEWPFIAALLSTNSGLSQFCGGSLIKPGWVVTAAHCPDPANVLIGRKDLTQSGGELIAVLNTIRHPAYDENVSDENDISLLRLGSDSTATPIALATPTDDPIDGETVHIAGWGHTSSGGSPSSQLLEADVEIVNNTTCDSAYGFDTIWPSMLCAAHFAPPATDTCQGDSGGPLTTDGLRLAGITSFGQGCAEPPYPGVYTRVSSFLSWIAQVTGRHAKLPDAPSFGNQLIGTTSAPKLVAITSDGVEPVTISGVVSDNPAFSIVDDGCSGTGPLPVGTACYLNVVFTPAALGSQTGKLTVASDSEDAVQKSVALYGFGIQNPAAPLLAPASIKLVQSGRGKRAGKRMTVSLKAYYAIPLGVPAAVACGGTFKATAKLRRPRKTVRDGAGTVFSGPRCVATLKLRLPRSAKRKKATVTLRFSGNNAFAPAVKKFTIRIR